MTIAIALTSQEPRAGFPLTLECHAPSLPKRSWIKISQIRTLSTERIGRRLTRISAEELARVVEGLTENRGKLIHGHVAHELLSISFTMFDTPVFLLSPARSDGPRARMLTNPAAKSDLAQQLRTPDGAPLGAVFAFASSLYFRGKLAYAMAHTPADQYDERIKVITTNRGLRSPRDMITVDELEGYSSIDIAGNDERYLGPLTRDVTRLARDLPAHTNVVLLGSIATGKYVDTLLAAFGDRLLFPADFVGRGDMSRGGLLLRHARAGTALTYVPVAGAVRHGKRPPKLGKPPVSS